MGELVASVDVGTASARAGIFDRAGRLLGRAVGPIAMRQPSADRADQDSENIWRSVAEAVRAARREAAARAEAVAGIGFDATCSLVLRDRNARPLATAPDAPDRWDTIVWLDHRARAEAVECGAAGGKDGGISPEMQIPKLLWHKRHHTAAWERLGAAFDLADFLSWRASGSRARSTCTLACKWGFQPRADRPWPEGFLAAIGLDDLLDRCALPEAAAPVGTRVGGLTETAAAELGLEQGTPVAAGLIDAHAGTLGLLGGFSDDPQVLSARRALIAGTSSCIMGFPCAPRRVPAHWGPHADAVLPGFWMLEGGQSASGALLDHLCQSWGGGEPLPAFRNRVFCRIGELMAAEGPDLAPRLHVLPDFHGNRTPHADPDALGVISGLPLDGSFDGFCRLFWRTCTGLALGLRQILEHQAAHGWPADRLHVAGGHARSPLLLQLYADATGRPIETPGAPDPVLLGTAMAAGTAARLFPDLPGAARSMHQASRTIAPDPASSPRIARDYAAFLALQRHRAEIDAISREAPGAGRGRSADETCLEPTVSNPVVASC